MIVPRSARRAVALAVGLVLLAAATAAAVLVLDGSPTIPATGVAGSKARAPIDLQFVDATGRTHDLAEFRGKAVLVNFWATWCMPCRKEMPTLDRLQGKLGGAEFQVVALSLDRGGPDRVREFLAEIGNTHLTLYLADPIAARTSLGIFGLPTTLLLDREGREVDRAVGPAEWDGAEKVAQIREKLGIAAVPVESGTVTRPADLSKPAACVPGSGICPLPATGSKQ